MEPPAIARLIEDTDAVIFAAGAGPGSGPERKRTVDYGAAVKLMDACGLAGVGRYLMVSGLGVSSPERWTDEMRPYWQAKADADEALTATRLDWTIVRPGRLTDDPGTGLVRRGGRDRVRRQHAARRRRRDPGRLPRRAQHGRQGLRPCRGRSADRRGAPGPLRGVRPSL